MTETMEMTGTMDMTDTMEGELEESLAMSDVPLIVSHTAQLAAEQYLAGATFAEVGFDPEGDVPAFEFAGTGSAGQAIEVDIYPDGVVEEIEEVIDQAEVPAETLAMLNMFFPEVQIDLVERSTRPTKLGLTNIYYEFEAVTADGVTLDVELNEDGTRMTVETTE